MPYDEGVAFVCVECGCEYTRAYVDDKCIDCQGRLRRFDGSLVEPCSDTPASAGDDESIDDDELDGAVLSPFETDNPWLQKLFLYPSYGGIPGRALVEFEAHVPDLEERVLAGIGVSNGPLRRGYLIATTMYLRWMQTLPSRQQDFWPYDYAIEARRLSGASIGGLITMPGGHQFQGRYAKLRRFVEQCRLVQQALSWAEEHSGDPAVEVPVVEVVSLASELERIGSLHERGLLDDEEFRAAKRKLLNG